MKKILTFLFVVLGFAAQAQFSIGSNVSANHFGYAKPNNQNKDYFYTFSPTLRVGYRWNDHFSAGINADISYLCNAEKRPSPVDDQGLAYPAYTYAQNIYRAFEHLSWKAGFWLRYDLHLTEHLLFFANLGIDAGSMYGRRISEDVDIYQFETRHTENSYYGNHNKSLASLGAVITPGVAYRFNTHWTAELWLDLLRMSYSHLVIKNKETTTAQYNFFHFGSQSEDEFYLDIDYLYQYTFLSSSNFRLGFTFTF